MITINFGNLNSYNDLGLFLADATFEEPIPKRVTVDIPYRDGILDLGAVISDSVVFNNRAIVFTFKVVDYSKDWVRMFSALANQIHGRQLHVEVSSDPGWYWDAFCTVTVQSENNLGTVIVTCNAYPYKLHDYSIDVSSTASGVTKVITITRQTVVPTITTNSNIIIQLRGESYSFDAGTYKNIDLRLIQGENQLRITGVATVSISYTDGSL